MSLFASSFPFLSAFWHLNDVKSALCTTKPHTCDSSLLQIGCTRPACLWYQRCQSVDGVVFYIATTTTATVVGEDNPMNCTALRCVWFTLSVSLSVCLCELQVHVPYIRVIYLVGYSTSLMTLTVAVAIMLSIK